MSEYKFGDMLKVAWGSEPLWAGGILVGSDVDTRHWLVLGSSPLEGFVNTLYVDPEASPLGSTSQLVSWSPESLRGFEIDHE